MRRFTVFCFFALFAALPLDAARVSWSHVEDAAEYRVEIENQWGGPVASFDTPYTFVNVQLVPGTYRIRISVLNKFRKVDAAGEWSLLVVRTGKKPELDSFAPRTFRTSQGSVPLTVRGQGFSAGSIVELVGTAGALRLETVRESATLLRATLPAANLAPGEYRVAVVTGDAQRVERAGLSVEPPRDAEIDDVAPDEFVASGRVRLVVKGEEFGTRVSLALVGKDASRRELGSFPVVDDRVTAEFDAGALTPGRFSLVVTASDGRSAREDVIVVRAPVSGTGPATNSAAGSSGDGTPIPFYCGLSLGSFAVDNNSSKTKMAFEQAFMPDFFCGLRLGPSVSLEAFISGTKVYAADTLLRTTDLGIIAVGIEGLWSPDLGWPVRPVLGLGGGIARSVLKSRSRTVYDDVLERTSSDGYLRCSLFLRWDIAAHLWLDAGVRLQQVLYTDGGFWLNGFALRAGLVF